ncbi:hypothetical protein Pcinc_001132 [Petrolisthes cinctipes]|uniref:Uncharacterized protein n=1 Tax=Petrolisthes cinctipes TaxID=88211 RepID=A0AAE1L4T8_PETCI|nr:hypothetical protein Pcinc_001132 [Petrolisthes cinctipes]
MEPFVTYFDQTTILLSRARRRGALIVFKLRARPVCGRPVRLSMCLSSVGLASVDVPWDSYNRLAGGCVLVRAVPAPRLCYFSEAYEAV